MKQNPDLLTDDRACGFTSEEVKMSRYSSVLTDEMESHGMALRALSKAKRVLDVGCGTGEFACKVRDTIGCDVVGIEPHSERAATAGAQSLKVITGFLTHDIAMAESPYDAVTLLDVLEHTSDPVELLSIATIGLQSKGIIVISVPNVAHWTVRFKLLLGRFDYRPTGIMDATHLRWFTSVTISDVVQAAGLRVQQQEVSRGLWLQAYQERLFWRLLPRPLLRKVVDQLCLRFPGLFGCQHFLVAVKD